MTILHLSDTHGKHRMLTHFPLADIIIHSGDFSYEGTEEEAIDFIEWFGALPYKHKIFIAGNHDSVLYKANIDGLPKGCIYLCNAGVTINGIKLYGIPMFIEDVVSGKYDRSIESIPDDTDVLITHQPPYHILDFSNDTIWGDTTLLKTVLRVKPKYHLFGHVHAANGVEKIDKTIFVNSALVDEDNQVSNEPRLIELSTL